MGQLAALLSHALPALSLEVLFVFLIYSVFLLIAIGSSLKMPFLLTPRHS